jgi:queuosine precursor transporter
MKISEKIYISLCGFFTLIIVLGNLIYQKFVILDLPFIGNFAISAGVILYPLSFLITDIITEIYGKEKSRFCVRLALCMNMITVSIIYGVDVLPSASWSKISQETFHKVFGFYSIAFFGSMLACYISQSVDILLYSTIKKLTGNNYLWLRSNVSTCISLLLDTCTVICFLTFFHILPIDQMFNLIYHSYMWKLFFTIFSTPIFYVIISFLRKLY